MLRFMLSSFHYVQSPYVYPPNQSHLLNKLVDPLYHMYYPILRDPFLSLVHISVFGPLPLEVQRCFHHRPGDRP